MKGERNPYHDWPIEKLVKYIDLFVEHEDDVDFTPEAQDQLQLLRAARNARL